METYTEYCKNFIKNNIYDHEGQIFYGCDLGSKLTEYININGSCTNSTYKAKQYIINWWDDAGDFLQYEKNNFGNNLHNPFERPESFHVCMIIEGVSSLLSKTKIIDKYMNNKFLLTPKKITKILKQIEDLEVCL